MLKSIFPFGSAGSWTTDPQGQLHASGLQQIRDAACIRDGPRETMQFWHNQRVTLAQNSNGLIQARACPIGTGQSVVRVDAVLTDTEFNEGLGLRRQVLPGGGAAGVSDLC